LKKRIREHILKVASRQQKKYNRVFIFSLCPAELLAEAWPACFFHDLQQHNEKT
jgi:hypothetical protein